MPTTKHESCGREQQARSMYHSYAWMFRLSFTAVYCTTCGKAGLQPSKQHVCFSSEKRSRIDANLTRVVVVEVRQREETKASSCTSNTISNCGYSRAAGNPSGIPATLQYNTVHVQYHPWTSVSLLVASTGNQDCYLNALPAGLGPRHDRKRNCVSIFHPRRLFFVESKERLQCPPPGDQLKTTLPGVVHRLDESLLPLSQAAPPNAEGAFSPSTTSTRTI